jgi:hypothetical protein
MLPSAAAIQSECERLGHHLGWRLLCSPARNVEAADVALITCNPAGNAIEPNRWSVEGGSAYVIESWKDYPPGTEKLQRQIRRMFDIMEVNPADVLSGYFVPFRSPNWRSLPRKDESIQFGIQIWREIFLHSKATTIIAFGKEIKRHVATLLAAAPRSTCRAGWGTQTIDVLTFGSHGKLVVLPHLSRFSLFNRPDSEQAFRAVVQQN